MTTENDVRSASPGEVHAVELDDVTKSFGGRHAVDGLTLRVDRGEVHALLGPNGSGKTTTVRMIATLMRPDRGAVRILGHDTVGDSNAAKRNLGLVGQFTALDLRLTGLENLTMFAALTGLSKLQAHGRAHELLDQFGLTDAADRSVGEWSGGMRRRLDILAALVVRPPVLLLDEPTTALDPVSRLEVYDMVRDMVADGMAVVLTTQYLDEADQLADQLTILDHGRVIAAGTPAQIKRTVGERISVAVPEDHTDQAISVATGFGLHLVDRAPGDVAGTTRLGLSVDEGLNRPALADVLRGLDGAGVVVDDIGRRYPSLDEAFLALTHEEASR